MSRAKPKREPPPPPPPPLPAPVTLYDGNGQPIGRIDFIRDKRGEAVPQRTDGNGVNRILTAKRGRPRKVAA